MWIAYLWQFTKPCICDYKRVCIWLQKSLHSLYETLHALFLENSLFLLSLSSWIQNYFGDKVPRKPCFPSFISVFTNIFTHCGFPLWYKVTSISSYHCCVTFTFLLHWSQLSLLLDFFGLLPFLINNNQYFYNTTLGIYQRCMIY